MDAQMLRDLELRLSSLERTTIRYRAGTVTATSPLSVSLGGSATAYTNVKSIGPITTGDQVACIVWGNDLVILGKLGGGGVALFHEVATNQNCTSTSYVDLATVGPTLTIPSAGDYEIVYGCTTGTSVANADVYATVKIGAAAAGAAEEVMTRHPATTAGSYQTMGKALRRTLAAADVIKMQYKTSTGTAQVLYRHLTIRPIRVG